MTAVALVTLFWCVDGARVRRLAARVVDGRSSAARGAPTRWGDRGASWRGPTERWRGEPDRGAPVIGGCLSREERRSTAANRRSCALPPVSPPTACARRRRGRSCRDHAGGARATADGGTGRESGGASGGGDAGAAASTWRHQGGRSSSTPEACAGAATARAGPRGRGATRSRTALSAAADDEHDLRHRALAAQALRDSTHARARGPRFSTIRRHSLRSRRAGACSRDARGMMNASTVERRRERARTMPRSSTAAAIARLEREERLVNAT